jgi:hypothetical protein
MLLLMGIPQTAVKAKLSTFATLHYLTKRQTVSHNFFQKMYLKDNIYVLKLDCTVMTRKWCG